MSIRFRIWFGLPLLAVLLAHAVPDTKKAVIVESVSPNSEGEKAGLKPGDMILRWTRDDTQGEIESPFDFFQIEIEQKPRGRVIAQGLRGTEKQSWTLGPDAWGVQTRPDLPENVLSVYRKCQALSDASTSSVEQCPPDTATAGPSWFKSWFALQAAEALARARQWQLSDKAYEQAVGLGHQAGSTIAAQVLYKWATACEGRGDLENAAKHYQESLLEYQNVNSESLTIAADLNGLGSVARKRGELEKAEDNCRRALAIAEKLAPGSLEVAVSFNNLGNIAWARRDLVTAAQHHQRALELRQKLAPGGLAHASSLNNLGLVAWQQGNLDKATEYQLQALAITQKLAPVSMTTAAICNNLGSIAWEHGDLLTAERFYRRALDIREPLAPDSLDLADNLNNLGLVAERRGELTQAEQCYRRAILIQQKHGAQTLEVANLLNNLANVMWEQGNHTAAYEYDRTALQIRQKVAPGSPEVAASLNNLGFSAFEQGNLAQAEVYDRQALEIERNLTSDTLLAGRTLTQLGDIARVRGDLSGAEKLYREALDIREKLASGSNSHAESLASLADIMCRKGQLDVAEKLFGQALQAFENQTERLGGEEEVRSLYRAQHAAYFADYIDLLFAQKRPALAFHVAERSRAQSFLETLNAARIDIHRGVDPALLAQKQRLEQSISSKSSERIDLLNGKHTQEEVAAIDQERAKLLIQYQQIGDQIRAASPGYADLMRPRVLTGQQVQDELLDPDTLLLEYALGEKHSYLWILSKTSLAAYELPRRATIETAARRLYNLLIHPGEASWGPAATSLSRMVLGPASGHLRTKRLIIVPDGALQYIPFEALPAPAASTSSKTNTLPLAVEHEIIYLPSASALAVLRRVDRAKNVPRKAVAVLADPVFDKEDVRVQTVAAGQKPTDPPAHVGEEDLNLSAEQFTRSAEDLGLSRLPRLPFSRREADAILAVTPSGQGSEFLDFQACRATATGSALADYRIIHFATHGLLDSKNPELSGLVLTLVDQQGNSQNGFLGLQDIYNLNLRADLVVLSACETALGKEVRGEGLVGLTRGFMYAGANRVLASLWKVDDVATAELMRGFYRFMGHQGMRPAAALRQAQLNLRKQKRWNQPYYWAGFQLQGEWK